MRLQTESGKVCMSVWESWLSNKGEWCFVYLACRKWDIYNLCAYNQGSWEQKTMCDLVEHPSGLNEQTGNAVIRLLYFYDHDTSRLGGLRAYTHLSAVLSEHKTCVWFWVHTLAYANFKHGWNWIKACHPKHSGCEFVSNCFASLVLRWLDSGSVCWASHLWTLVTGSPLSVLGQAAVAIRGEKHGFCGSVHSTLFKVFERRYHQSWLTASDPWFESTGMYQTCSCPGVRQHQKLNAQTSPIHHRNANRRLGRRTHGWRNWIPHSSRNRRHRVGHVASHLAGGQNHI